MNKVTIIPPPGYAWGPCTALPTIDAAIESYRAGRAGQQYDPPTEDTPVSLAVFRDEDGGELFNVSDPGTTYGMDCTLGDVPRWTDWWQDDWCTEVAVRATEQHGVVADVLDAGDDE